MADEEKKVLSTKLEKDVYKRQAYIRALEMFCFLEQMVMFKQAEKGNMPCIFDKNKVVGKSL